MNRFAVGLAAGILLGAVATWLGFFPNADEPDTGGRRDATTRGDSTRSAASLAGSPQDPEIDVAALLAEVEGLRSRLEEHEREGPGGAPIPAEEMTEEEEARDAAGLPSAEELRALREAQARAPEPWFDEDELVAFGISEREVERIRLRWEQYVMDQLRAAAALEGKGKMAGRRIRLVLLALAEGVREDLGDDSYDAMLYASGAKNRVVIADILGTSPAAESGARSGDEVLRYAGQRIFSPASLQRLVKAAPQGELVRIEVLRDGEVLSLYVERGPLGIKLGASNQPPYLE